VDDSKEITVLTLEWEKEKINLDSKKSLQFKPCHEEEYTQILVLVKGDRQMGSQATLQILVLVKRDH